MALIDSETHQRPQRRAAIAPSPRRARNVLVGLWLTMVFIAPLAASVLAPGPTGLSAALLLALAWPLLLPQPGRSTGITVRPALRVATAIAVLFSMASIVVSETPVVSLGYLALTVLALYTCARLCAGNVYEQLPSVMRWYSLFMCPPIIYLAAFANVESTRSFAIQSVDVNPNALALGALSAAVAAFSHRHLLTRLALVLPPLYLIHLASARGSLVAFALAMTVSAALAWRYMSSGKRMAVAVASLIAMSFALTQLPAIASYAAEVLLVNDEHRGIASGGSGRTAAWAETFNLFLASPVVGVGYRAHEVRMTTATSSHNGYLALLAEIGLFGFLAVMTVLAIAVRDLLLNKRTFGKSGRPLIVGFIFAYLFVAMVERYLVNVGNPTSLLFILALGHQYWSASPSSPSGAHN